MSDRLNLDGGGSKSAPARLKSLQSFQVLLLRHALLNFPSVKRVVYSTCSMYQEENEMVVDEILSDIGQSYKLKSVKKLLGGNWKNYSSEEFACGNKCLYAKPEIDYSNGFFVAVFERNFEIPLPDYKRKKSFTKVENGQRFENANRNAKNSGDYQKNEDELQSSLNPETKKSKKKRKRAKSENGETEGLVQTESAINIDNSVTNIPEKKKIAVETIFTADLPVEEQTGEVKTEKVKKKKKKKQKDHDILE